MRPLVEMSRFATRIGGLLLSLGERSTHHAQGSLRPVTPRRLVRAMTTVYL